MPPFQFISFDSKSSKRDKELTIAEIRAHAARVSHLQRVHRLHGEQEEVLSTTKKTEHQQVGTAFDPWHMSQGYRNDPFDVVPGSNQGVAAVAFDFRQHQHPKIGRMLTLPSSLVTSSLWLT